VNEECDKRPYEPSVVELRAQIMVMRKEIERIDKERNALLWEKKAAEDRLDATNYAMVLMMDNIRSIQRLYRAAPPDGVRCFTEAVTSWVRQGQGDNPAP
jgi:hypothetical protein